MTSYKKHIARLALLLLISNRVTAQNTISFQCSELGISKISAVAWTIFPGVTAFLFWSSKRGSIHFCTRGSVSGFFPFLILIVSRALCSDLTLVRFSKRKCSISSANSSFFSAARFLKNSFCLLHFYKFNPAVICFTFGCNVVADWFGIAKAFGTKAPGINPHAY